MRWVIIIYPGKYNESLTLYSNIDLTGLSQTSTQIGVIANSHKWEFVNGDANIDERINMNMLSLNSALIVSYKIAYK